MTNRRIAMATIGCKVNFCDTEALLQKFVEMGYVPVEFDDAADLYVINTCSITNLADKKSRQMVRQAKRRNPAARVAVMGCSSEAQPRQFTEIGVDIVVGTSDRTAILDLMEGKPNPVAEPDFGPAHIEKMSGKTRAFLKIQDGCDNFCTYCIIPLLRGKPRSRPLDDIADQAAVLAKNGYKEIVVTGICVSSYGKNFNDCNFVDALQVVCNTHGIERVRLSSVSPNAVTTDFLEFAARNPKFCDHVHLSLQSGCDRILRIMNRGYSAEQYKKCVELLRKTMPNVGITADVIVGFPTETDAEHAQTLHFIEDLGLCGLHVFQYSPKEGTAAAKMDKQVQSAVKKSRAAEMSALANRLTERFYSSFSGKVASVLVEKKGTDGVFFGKTTNYAPVEIRSDTDLTGQIVDVAPIMTPGGLKAKFCCKY